MVRVVRWIGEDTERRCGVCRVSCVLSFCTRLTFPHHPSPSLTIPHHPSPIPHQQMSDDSKVSITDALHKLNLQGNNFVQGLRDVSRKLDVLRTTSLGARPTTEWVVPLVPSSAAVMQSKLVSLNSKRRANDQLDKVLLELVVLQKRLQKCQELTYKHAVLKQIRLQIDTENSAAIKTRQDEQEALLLAQAASLTALAERKKKRKIAEVLASEESPFLF